MPAIPVKLQDEPSFTAFLGYLHCLFTLIITRNLLPGPLPWARAPLPGGFRKRALSTDGQDPRRHRWTRSLEEMSKERAQLGHEKENKHLVLAMAVGKGVIRSVVRIWGRKLPCSARHPLSSWGFLSPQCEKAEAHGYLHSSHSTNKVSLRFISSRKVLRNIKGIGICSLRTCPADLLLAEEKLQGLIYPIVDD